MSAIDLMFTNAPCGGVCDEIEEGAAQDDCDEEVEFPCDECEYNDYYQLEKRGRS